MKKLIFNFSLAFVMLCVVETSAQGVAINVLGNAPDPKALLDVSGTDKGVLIPRLDSNHRISLTPLITDIAASGLMVYDTDYKCIYVWRRGIDPNPVNCWFSLCNGSGSSGTPGPTGATGVTGVTGATGITGATGLD